MKTRVILDTGPLVASINRRDRFHVWAQAQLGQIAPPMFTCEPVLAEACFLLRDSPGGAEAVLAMVERGVLQVEFQVAAQIGSLAALMAKYIDIPMSLADACLVRMTELIEGSAILTLDKNFLVYRRHGRRVIPVVMPDETTA